MARRKNSELEFGSDSFLDIVANVVGILIILIVVAAVRVSRTPVTEQEIAARSPELSESLRVEEDVPLEPAREIEATPPAVAPDPPQPMLAGPAFAPPEPAPPEPAPVVPSVANPSPELIEKVDELRREMARLAQEKEKRRALLATAAREEQSLRQRISEADLSRQQRLTERQASLREAALFEGTINEIAGQLALARRQLETLEKAKSPATSIKHKVTPVGRTVTGTELHFHLSNNRVSVVPLEDLVDKLKSQVSRQKEWLAKYRRHQGEVGPVDGFTLRYVVEREEVSAIESLQQGVGTMRIGVSEWQVRPESDLKGETSDRALRLGSAFTRSLRKAGPDTTLTFWVYPDSFALYRELTEFAHKEGFTVAARPLPVGLLISGSPNGTRSTGQ